MIKKTCTVFAIVFATMLLGCNKDFNAQPDYVGTWSNSSGNTVTLGANNTYSVSANSILISSGNYSAKKNVFSLTGTVGYCHDSLPATYTYTYYVTTTNGTFTRNLTLVADADSCSARVAVIPGNYSIPSK